MTARLADVITALDAAYPPGLAQDWDAVGLVCGDPDETVASVLVAVDPVPATVDEALDTGAQLLLTHHPLLLRGVHGVGADTPKGALIHRLVRGGAAVFTAHTNADAADPGVSNALADALGLDVEGPLEGVPSAPMDKVVTFVPVGPAITAVHEAMAAAGAGAIGDYSHCAFASAGTGQFKPLAGARPTIGQVGKLERVAETRLEMVLPRGRRSAVLAALRSAHPYEEPAFDVVELADPRTSSTGAGRIGSVPPTTLGAFAETVAGVLPGTAHGVRVAGDPARAVRRVAVCGGAGDFLLDEVLRSGADVYVTSDLRHHPAAEFLEKDGPALVDVSHWAAEWTWLPAVRGRLGAAWGDTVETRVSTRCTDPWTFRI
jgi:dinuclear metal center YbgI/SA1388 family protein